MDHVKTRQDQNLTGKAFLKATVLLAIGVFLIMAPAPDSRIIEEITSNLIVIAQNTAL